MKRIIYPTPEGGVAILIPTGELPLEEVARKDVPDGVQYKIIDATDVPTDRTFRDAWEADIASPDGHGIGAAAWFIEQFQAEIAKIEAETPPVAPEPIPVVPFEAVEFEEGMTEEARQAGYAKYVADVEAANAQQVTDHEAAVASWEANKAHRISELNAQIAAQQKELAA